MGAQSLRSGSLSETTAGTGLDQPVKNQVAQPESIKFMTYFEPIGRHSSVDCYLLSVVSVVPPNNAFERSVMRWRNRAANALAYCAPAARTMRHRAAAQRER